MQLNKIYNADCIEGMRNMPANSVDVCVTSPPYFALRDYGIEGQIGLENSPDAFVAKLGDVGDEIFRVLKPHGTLWLNLGDSYAGSGKGIGSDHGKAVFTDGEIRKTNWGAINLKPKDLIGIPWMVAFEFRRRGWYLRQDNIWHKPNPMPESVTDRCTKAHEYIFLLSKSQKYYFDAEAIKQNAVTAPERVHNGWKENHGPQTKGVNHHKNLQSKGQRNHTMHEKRLGLNGSGFKGHSGNYSADGELIGNGKANKRSVWTVTTQPYTEAHFATFPEELIVDCIKAGSSEHGVCSKCGKPYKRVFTKKLVPTSKAAYNSKIDQRDLLADKNDQGSNRMKDGHKSGWVNKTETIDWVPTCKCDATPAPAIVFDPFMGAGTTAVVARKLNRNFVGIELNPKYITIAEKRLRKEIGLFL